MIGPILRLGVNELRLTMKERANLVWMLLMPVVFILFFGSVTGGGASGPANATINLVVVDNDVSWLSRALVEALAGEDFAVTEVAPDEAVGRESRKRTLIIPAGLGAAVAAGKQVKLLLVAEADASIEANAVAEIHVTRALTRLIGGLVEMDDAAGVPGSLDLRADRLAELRRMAARPPLVLVESAFAGQGRPTPQGFGQAIPGMMTQFIIMIVMLAGGVYLTEEKLSGVLRRLAVAPFTPRTLIVGKLTGLVFLALLQAAFLIAAGTAIGKLGILGADFYWCSSPSGLLLMLVAFAIATAGITLFFGAMLSSPSQAGAVGWLAGMLMAGLGGCWWPLELVPAWLRTAGHIFPTAWMMDGLHELISFGKGIEAVLPEAAILLAYGVVFGLLGARFLKVQA
jgi:ABC-type multidrug transport system permease subunit